MNRQKSKSTFSATLLALILGVAGFLGSPAWAAEPPIDPATGKLLGFSSQEVKNAEPEYGGTITAISNFGGSSRLQLLMSHIWFKSSVFQTERELQSKLESH